MTRPARTWLLFALCLAVALAGLGWITTTTLQLDRAQRAAEKQAVIEENTRLALWRMDSAVLPILMDENARPYFQYSPQYHVQHHPNDPNGLSPELDTVLNQSPLVAQEVPFRCVYFQVDPAGNVISPQLPGVVNKKIAASSPVNAQPNLARQVQWLNELQDTAQLQTVAQAIPDATDEPSRPTAAADAAANLATPPPQPQAAPRVATKQLDYTSAKDAGYQAKMNSSDYQARQELSKLTSNRNADPPGAGYTSAGQALASAGPPSAQPPVGSRSAQQDGPPGGQQHEDHGGQQAGQAPPSDSRPTATGEQPPQQLMRQEAQPAPQQVEENQAVAAVQFDRQPLANIYTDNNWYQPINRDLDPAQVGTMTPLWRNHRLLLTRKVAVAGQDFAQGVWLDWPALRQKLLADVADLLPNARLEPLDADTSAPGRNGAEAARAGPHRLALLPVQLLPGDLPLAALPGLSPVERVLVIAWIAIVLAALAAAALLYGVVALSERRAAFVSAVTHELRTPLTTFRMYTEMLGAGMVRDEEKKSKYLATMRAEAVRLGHLVENVLAYARLERGGHHNPRAGRLETVTVDDLIARIEPHLNERAEQAQMTFTVNLGDAATAAARLATDPAAVEQILFNLVDNACKYGRSATPDNRPATATTPAADPPSAPAGRIELSARLTRGHLILQVRDHGAGIPADQRARLFQPFSRSAEIAANTPTRTPGVGLGLALCRRLARALGGEIRWQAAIADGAAFDLQLPTAE